MFLPELRGASYFKTQLAKALRAQGWAASDGSAPVLRFYILCLKFRFSRWQGLSQKSRGLGRTAGRDQQVAAAPKHPVVQPKGPSQLRLQLGSSPGRLLAAN